MSTEKPKPGGRAKKKAEVSLLRSSAAEYLTFVAAGGGSDASVEMRYEDENVWLTQKMMAALYDVSIPAINQHLKRIFSDNELDESSVVKSYLIAAADGKNYQTKHYSLQAIIAVGFKIENERAVQFRKWANQIVKDYTIQGWTMDAERLKHGGTLLPTLLSGAERGGIEPWQVIINQTMPSLSKPNIESELSYAYLHAVASKAGMACNVGSRHEDNNGVDATLTAWGPFNNGGYLTEVDIKVQLKATIAKPADDGTNLSYFLSGVNRYNDLRTLTVNAARILVVLFLPDNEQEWLNHSVDELALRKCAYWQSLRGAPAIHNSSGTTVYLPKMQTFNVQSLTELATRLSHRDFPTYPAL